MLIGRDPGRLGATAAWIDGRVRGSTTRTVQAELSLLSEVRRAAEEVVAVTPSLDVLVNNAGLLSPRRTETREGHELTLAVNHLAPFVLIRALLPALQESGAGRVVMTGSSTSDHAWIDPDDLELRRGWFMTRAYARSKLALLMTSVELSAQLRGTGTTVNVVHPGLVATGLVKGGGLNQLGWKALAPFSLTELQGADTPLHACLSPSLAGVSGCYLKRRTVVAPNRRVLDPALRARVLAATERLVTPA